MQEAEQKYLDLIVKYAAMLTVEEMQKVLQYIDFQIVKRGCR